MGALSHNEKGPFCPAHHTLSWLKQPSQKNVSESRIGVLIAHGVISGAIDGSGGFDTCGSTVIDDYCMLLKPLKAVEVCQNPYRRG